MCQNKRANLKPAANGLEHFRKCCSQSSQARYNRLLGSGDKYYTAAAPWRWCQVCRYFRPRLQIVDSSDFEHLKKPAKCQKLAISGTFK